MSTGSPSVAAGAPPRPGVQWAWALLAAAVAISVAVRVRLLEMPFERDEGEYAYGGQLLLAGTPPYVDLYNMKLPGAQLAYAAAMAAFGESIVGARIGLLLANLATAAAVLGLGRRLLGALGGAAAAAAFLLFSLQVEMLGLFGHATHFVALFASLGLWLLFGALDSGRRSLFAASGLALGGAVLMKQPGGVFVILALAALTARRLQEPVRAGQRWAQDSALLVGSAAAAVTTMLAWIAGAGRMESFRLWVLDYGRSYAGLVTWQEGLSLLRLTFGRIASEAPGLWACAAVGLALVAWSGPGIGSRRFLAALTGASALGVAPGFYFRDHYFLLALPAAALLVGAAVRTLAELLTLRGWPRLAAPVALVPLALAGAQFLIAQREIYFHLEPHEVARTVYGDNPFVESIEVARHLRAHTSREDRIAVFGSEPQIFFYAQRRSATGFIYMYPLMEAHPLARRMQEEMIREVEQADPVYIVWIRVPTSWLETPRSERLVFEWAQRTLPKRYEVAGQVLAAGTGSTYLWDEAARGAVAPATSILVLRRRDDRASGR